MLVDEDAHITELLEFNLGSEGFGVMTSKEASLVGEKDFDKVRLVVADAMTQDYTGMDLLRAMKSDPLTSHIPVIICTYNDSEDAIIRAFDDGADDYVVKPFSLRELVARIKSVLRRHPLTISPAPSTILSLHGLDVDIVRQRVTENGNPVILTKTEFAILSFLLRHRDCFFSRAELRNEIWKNEAGTSDRAVDTNISRLRKKLGPAGAYLINRYGKGYAIVDRLPQ